MSPINPNFFYFERKCVVCGHGMLLAEADLHKPPVPCSRCVKGGHTAYNDKPQIRLTFEDGNNDEDGHA